MKRTAFFLAILLTFFGITCLHSQSPSPLLPRTALGNLQAIKLKNAEILEKQKATLEKLDELVKESEQIKALGKRT